MRDNFHGGEFFKIEFFTRFKCGIQFNLQSNITPSIFILFWHGILLLSNFFWSFFCFLFFVNIMLLDFRLEMLKPVLFNQFDMLFALFCNKSWTIFSVLLLHSMFKSSANRFAVTGVLIVLKISFIDRRKIVTASDDRWRILFFGWSCSKGSLLHWLGIFY